MRAVPAGRLVLFAALAVGGCSLDLATKSWAFARLGMPQEGRTLPLLGNVLSLSTSLNEGALFGVAQGRGLWICLLSLAAMAGILAWLVAGGARDRPLTMALGLISAGILGNLYDRLGLPGLRWAGDAAHGAGEPVHAVRDWIHFQIEGLIDWPLFNIADSLLVVGGALLVWHALWLEPRRARRSVEAHSDTPLAT